MASCFIWVPFSLWQLPEHVQMISSTTIPGYHRFRGVRRCEKLPIVEKDWARFFIYTFGARSQKTQPDISLHSSIKHFPMDSVQSCLSKQLFHSEICAQLTYTYTAHPLHSPGEHGFTSWNSLSDLLDTRHLPWASLLDPKSVPLFFHLWPQTYSSTSRIWFTYQARSRFLPQCSSILMAALLLMGNNYLESLLPYRKCTISGLHGHPQKLLWFIFIICITYNSTRSNGCMGHHWTEPLHSWQNRFSDTIVGLKKTKEIAFRMHRSLQAGPSFESPATQCRHDSSCVQCMMS